MSFNPAEWSRNACILAEYLTRLSLHPAAGRCLVAAQAGLRLNFVVLMAQLLTGKGTCVFAPKRLAIRGVQSIDVNNHNNDYRK